MSIPRFTKLPPARESFRQRHGLRSAIRNLGCDEAKTKAQLTNTLLTGTLAHLTTTKASSFQHTRSRRGRGAWAKHQMSKEDQRDASQPGTTTSSAEKMSPPAICSTQALVGSLGGTHGATFLSSYGGWTPTSRSSLERAARYHSSALWDTTAGCLWRRPCLCISRTHPAKEVKTSILRSDSNFKRGSKVFGFSKKESTACSFEDKKKLRSASIDFLVCQCLQVAQERLVQVHLLKCSMTSHSGLPAGDAMKTKPTQLWSAGIKASGEFNQTSYVTWQHVSTLKLKTGVMSKRLALNKHLSLSLQPFQVPSS